MSEFTFKAEREEYEQDQEYISDLRERGDEFERMGESMANYSFSSTSTTTIRKGQTINKTSKVSLETRVDDLEQLCRMLLTRISELEAQIRENEAKQEAELKAQIVQPLRN